MRYDRIKGHQFDPQNNITHITMGRACRDCGQELRDEDDVFCPKCGHKYTRRLPGKVDACVVIDLLNANWKGKEVPA